MNAYSIIHNYQDKELYTPDFDFIQSALTYKQQSSDVNRSRIQKAYDQVAILQVAKGVDQQYIDERLKQVADIGNRYASMDVSDANFANSIISNVGQVFDKKVENAVVSTKVIEAENKYIESLKGTDKYSEKSHAFAIAMSDRKRYLNSEEAGDKYQAGLDYREYRDVRGKLMKVMPDLAKMYFDQSKELERSAGAGQFSTINTYQEVERERVRNAIMAQLDDKDRAYLEVEAWAEYDQIPDDYIREEYNAKINSQLGDVTRNLQGLETMVAGLKDNDPRKAQYQDWIASNQEKKKVLEEGDYDNMLSKLGPQGRRKLYSGLYQEKFVGEFTEAFQVERKLVDIEIDKANEANVNFNYKVSQDKLAQANKDREFELSVLKYKNEVLKNSAAGTDKTGKQGFGDGDGVYSTLLQTSDYDDKQNPLARLQQEEREAMTGFNSIFGMRPGVGSLAKLKKEFANLAEKRANGGVINFNGKEVNVKNLTSAQYADLVRVNNLVVEDHPIKSKYEDKAYEGLQKQIQTLTVLVDANSGSSAQGRKGNSMNIYELPRMTHKFDKNGKWVPIADVKNDHHYVRLLKKNAKGELDKWDKATLEVYAARHIASDNILSQEEKRLVTTSVKKNLILNQGVSAQELSRGVLEAPIERPSVNSEAKTAYYIPSGKTQYFLEKNGVRLSDDNFNMTPSLKNKVQKLDNLYAALEKAPKDKKVLTQLETLKQEIRFANNSMQGKSTGQDYYLSELDYWDRDYTKGGENKRTAGFDDIWKTTRNEIHKIDEAYNVATAQELEYYAPVYTPKAANYGKITGTLQVMEKLDGFKIDTKQSVAASPMVDGKYSETEVAIKVMNSKGESRTIKVSKAEAFKMGIEVAKPERTAYDARFGTNAAKLDLGTGNLSNNIYANDAVINNYNTYLSAGLTPEIGKIISAYKAGEINVVLEPNKNTETYDAVLYRNGKIIPNGRIATTTQIMLSADIDEMSRRSGETASFYVDAYIQQQLSFEKMFQEAQQVQQTLNGY